MNPEREEIMTGAELEKLRKALDRVADRYYELNRRYRNQTGRDYKRPIYVGEKRNEQR